MSLLWPEYLTLGVFPGACWLQLPGGPMVAGADIDRTSSHLDLLDAVDALLERRAGSWGKRASVEVVVSDTIGLTVALPWQENLSAPEHLRSYARVLLESQHAIDGKAWTVEAGFRHFRNTGVGVALPEEWLARLVERLALRGLRLRGVLPVSAVAYWQAKNVGARGQSLLLIEEATRATALVYRNQRLHAIDAQPLLGDAGEAGERLCRRLQAVYGDVRNVALWSLSETELFAGAVKRCLPQVVPVTLPVGHWRRK